MLRRAALEWWRSIVVVVQAAERAQYIFQGNGSGRARQLPQPGIVLDRKSVGRPGRKNASFVCSGKKGTGQHLVRVTEGRCQQGICMNVERT